MPIINRIAEFHDDMRQWRHHIHAHPELGFDCHETAKFVAERLKEFGVDEIHDGIASSGLVAIINGQNEGVGEGPTIGLRADMDALPIIEAPDRPHKSTVEGKMHACGHDGHTTMLLGAASYLAETRNFSGRVALIFQPAEEGGGGGKVMCDEGMMERFDISQVYGIHNAPGVPVGKIQLNPGPLLAAADFLEIRITGQGGHGANPEETKDPVVAAVHLVQAIQTISSRNLAGLDDVVISITQLISGTAGNIIPSDAFIAGTVRTLEKSAQAVVVKRMQSICDGTAAMFDVDVKLDYSYGYPPTVNHPKEAAFAADVARNVVGDGEVEDNVAPIMAAEDFAFMLEERPGAYVFLGQGDGPTVHHPDYDFNDEISPVGASFFVKLVETAQPR